MEENPIAMDVSESQTLFPIFIQAFLTSVEIFKQIFKFQPLSERLYW
jgi:hypothetical protein